MIFLNSDTLRFTGVSMLNPHHAVIADGITVITGPNGSGKTTLAKIIEGGWNYMTNDISTDLDHRPVVRRIEFNDIHSLSSFKVEYYQQRFESTMNEEVPTVRELFGDKTDSDIWRRMAGPLGLERIIDKKLNYLSSGELRKMLVANMMFDLPEVLVLDNPYIGLDTPSRGVLDEAIRAIADSGVPVVMLSACASEIPDGAGAVIPVKDMAIGAPLIPGRDGDIGDIRRKVETLFDYAAAGATDIPGKTAENTDTDTPAVEMRHCEVRYGSKVLLHDVSWEIRRGERWVLAGPNGSGKSTLLSLINADNPQSYSNDIRLFGRQRGTGESIWEIKRRIGYISPERHTYFQAGNRTAIEVVAGGLKETVDNFKPLTDNQLAEARVWLRLLGAERLADRKFATLSFGEQRLILLGATLIKQPELMILDEPLHGLDSAKKLLVNKLIDTLASRPGATLIYVTHYADEIPGCVTRRKELTRRG